jgi:hypothetical protein
LFTEQNATFSSNCDDWLFKTDVGSVNCAVRTGRLLGVFAAFRKATLSFVTPVGPHGATRLPLNGFSRNLILEGVLIICEGNSSLIEI